MSRLDDARLLQHPPQEGERDPEEGADNQGPETTERELAVAVWAHSLTPVTWHAAVDAMKILSVPPLIAISLTVAACIAPDEQPAEPVSAPAVEVAAVCSPYQACDTQSPACSCPSGFLCAAGLCVRDDNPWTECYSTADCSSPRAHRTRTRAGDRSVISTRGLRGTRAGAGGSLSLREPRARSLTVRTASAAVRSRMARTTPPSVSRPVGLTRRRSSPPTRWSDQSRQPRPCARCCHPALV